MLTCIGKVRKTSSEHTEQGGRIDRTNLRFGEQFTNNTPVLFSNFTFPVIHLMDKTVAQVRAVREALNSGVEVARVATIMESTHLKKNEPIIFKMEHARKMCDDWIEPVMRSKTRKNVEIEWRFGRTGTRFDTNVGKDAFDRFLRGLRKYNGWESTRETEQTVYYFDGNIRTTIDDKTDEQVTVTKKNIARIDNQLDAYPFDVRLSIATEAPTERDEDAVANSSKTKHRWSFIRKNLSIDLTIMKGDPDDKDCDEDTTYHVEFEVVDPSLIKDQNELFNMIHKTFDLMKLIS